nr:MAG TPA: hypothetical protein [Caudoviricetes sp.]
MRSGGQCRHPCGRCPPSSYTGAAAARRYICAVRRSPARIRTW